MRMTKVRFSERGCVRRPLSISGPPSVDRTAVMSTPSVSMQRLLSVVRRPVADALAQLIGKAHRMHWRQSAHSRWPQRALALAQNNGRTRKDGLARWVKTHDCPGVARLAESWTRCRFVHEFNTAGNNGKSDI